MAFQYLVNSITLFHENAVFITFEDRPSDIIKNVKSFDSDLKEFIEQGKLAIVDVSPELDILKKIQGDYDFSALLVRIKHAIQNIHAKRVAIDSISAIISRFPDPAIIRRELFRIVSALKVLGVTCIITGERTNENGSITRYDVEEFVADNVVILRNILDTEKKRRTVEILKYRGAAHQKGEFPFTISENGVEVLPLSAMKLTMESSDSRISSGNETIYTMCGGGLYNDSIVLASGATVQEKLYWQLPSCRKGVNKVKNLSFLPLKNQEHNFYGTLPDGIWI